MFCTLYNGHSKNLEQTNFLLYSDSIKPIPQSGSPHVFKTSALSSSPSFVPEVVTAFEAALQEDNTNGIDIRPRLRDGNTNQLTLLDSGSQCTVVKPDPNDVEDSTILLESVNGQKVKCYGKKKHTIRLGLCAGTVRSDRTSCWQ